MSDSDSPFREEIYFKNGRYYIPREWAEIEVLGVALTVNTGHNFSKWVGKDPKFDELMNVHEELKWSVLKQHRKLQRLQTYQIDVRGWPRDTPHIVEYRSFDAKDDISRPGWTIYRFAAFREYELGRLIGGMAHKNGFKKKYLKLEIVATITVFLIDRYGAQWRDSWLRVLGQKDIEYYNEGDSYDEGPADYYGGSGFKLDDKKRDAACVFERKNAW